MAGLGSCYRRFTERTGRDYETKPAYEAKPARGGGLPNELVGFVFSSMSRYAFRSLAALDFTRYLQFGDRCGPRDAL